ncbi:MAG: hypothetical protein ACD_75C02151G0003 [uncultured bacterium]|nr:MAG: hypothetical protein ACD_75C02151G0003 [uncultured bacterium]
MKCREPLSNCSSGFGNACKDFVINQPVYNTYPTRRSLATGFKLTERTCHDRRYGGSSKFGGIFPFCRQKNIDDKQPGNMLKLKLLCCSCRLYCLAVLAAMFTECLKKIRKMSDRGDRIHCNKKNPGMTVTADVKVGKRRVMEYLLRPIMGYKEQSLREI